jgi:hypothetical protein
MALRAFVRNTNKSSRGKESSCRFMLIEKKIGQLLTDGRKNKMALLSMIERKQYEAY